MRIFILYELEYRTSNLIQIWGKGCTLNIMLHLTGCEF